MESKLDAYITENLSKFIRYHLERGYKPIDVKRSLNLFGYEDKQIENITKSLDIKHKKLEKKYSLKDLDGDTYYYLRGMISSYVENQLNHGFELQAVRKALIEYGHNRTLVHDAIALIQSKRKVRFSHDIVMGGIFIIVLGFMFFMSLVLNASYGFIFSLFSPIFISLVVAYFVTPFLLHNREIISVIAVLVVIVSFLLIFPGIDNGATDASVVLVVNAVISFLAATLFAMSYVPKPRIVKRNK